MKQRLLVLYCVLTAFHAKGQEQQKAIKDFVFEVPRMDFIKTLPEFKSYIKTSPEIQFAGFCESRNLVMLKMPENDLTIVTHALESMNLTYFLKENATVDQAISTCEYKQDIELSKSSN